jgi:hypothetical protein
VVVALVQVKVDLLQVSLVQAAEVLVVLLKLLVMRQLRIQAQVEVPLEYGLTLEVDQYRDVLVELADLELLLFATCVLQLAVNTH